MVAKWMTNKIVVFIVLAALMLMVLNPHFISVGAQEDHDSPDEIAEDQEDVTESETDEVETTADESDSLGESEEIEEAESIAESIEREENISIPLSNDYDLYTENSILQLYANNQGHVAVKDKRNDYYWRSMPDDDSLARETVEGHWRRNLTSPFYLEYIDVDKGESNLQSSNLEELEATAIITPRDNGLEVVFDLQSIQSSFTYVITLEGDHLDVSIPEDQIVEGEGIRFVNLWVLPFLGAAQSSQTDGYMFVPDRMGAIIPFEKDSSYPFRYSTRVYGQDLGITQQTQRRDRDDESDAMLPVFGISYNDNALLGVIAENDAHAHIHATPSGLYTTFNWISPQISYRDRYFRRTSSFGAGFNVYPEKMNREDSRVRYYFLQGEEKNVNYVGLAGAYRSYLMDEVGLTRIEPTEQLPLDLYIFGGDLEPGIFGPKLVQTTTFDQAREIVNSLETAGIDQMDVTFMGWSHDGYTSSLPDRFPAEGSLGGNEGLARLVEDVNRGGHNMYLEDNFVIAFSGNNFKPRGQALRDSNTRVIEETWGSDIFSFSRNRSKYWMRPGLSMEHLESSLPTFKEWSLDGINHDEIGMLIYSDGNPDDPYTREDTKQIFQEILKKTKEELGNVRASHGNAYILGLVDHISQFPLSSTHDLLARESVPFYPIAIHGLVPFSSEPGNLRNENQTGFLKSIEYGALPAYLLTYENSIDLRHSYTRYIYSSQYENWLDTILEEYQRMDAAMADIQGSFIVNHQQIAGRVFETTYDTGKRIYINYNDVPYSDENVHIEPNDFTVLQRGE